MKKYEILEHKADLKIRVFGKTKQKLFLNAVFAMQEAMRPELQSIKSKIRKAKVKSSDLPLLLVDFLSEVLYLVQINKEIYTDINFSKFSDTELEAQIFGKKAERFGLDIKAVTYHQLEIRHKKNGLWEATIIFDI